MTEVGNIVRESVFQWLMMLKNLVVCRTNSCMLLFNQRK